ncbi:alpha-amylase family protein [Propionibacterium acidifaciens]|uniref:alpha-amylase family protein n=1 Tax=Propionibacterium acidifaciens TaxID=556499 RepID=UPI0028EFB7B6|nr:alpha-amylase family protein [Propionibacterium acidifaciens]
MRGDRGERRSAGPAWIDHCIWWHVYPLGLTGAPIRPTGAERVPVPRLDRITPWLDHLIALGANGLALGPVFRSESHGYDTTDFFAIDERLGDDAAFDRLIAECRRRGIVVMLDGVFNHVGTAHPLFRKALAGGPEEAMFRIDRSGGELTYADFEGHRGLAALNHESEAVVDLVSDVMRHWLRRGASAWRLDAAYRVPPEFWARVLPRVRAEFPASWFVGEVIHGDHREIIRRSEMDSLTQYELWKAIWSSLLDGNFFELDWCLTRHDRLMDEFVPMTFVGNHDVTRIATRIGDQLAALAVVILFTVGGIPSVYYGDEYAWRGVKTDGPGGDDEIRPAFPDGPARLPSTGDWMLRLYQRLIGLRRQNPWLVHAVTGSTHLANRSYSYESRGPDGQRLCVDLVLDPEPAATVSGDGAVLLRVDRTTFR